jgi:diphthine-ammonia ligase
MIISCQRLGLTTLAYLWQRDQSELLDEMVGAGMEAILIKVAGIGLTPKHLGKTLAQMQPTLLNLVSRTSPCLNTCIN